MPQFEDGVAVAYCHRDYETRQIAAVVAALVLCACASTDPVFLQDAMGRTAQCGPYSKLLGNIPSENETAEMQVRKCVSALELQGYEVVAAPGEDPAGRGSSPD